MGEGGGGRREEGGGRREEGGSREEGEEEEGGERGGGEGGRGGGEGEGRRGWRGWRVEGRRESSRVRVRGERGEEARLKILLFYFSLFLFFFYIVIKKVLKSRKLDLPLKSPCVPLYTSPDSVATQEKKCEGKERRMQRNNIQERVRCIAQQLAFGEPVISATFPHLLKEGGGERKEGGGATVKDTDLAGFIDHTLLKPQAKQVCLTLLLPLFFFFTSSSPPCLSVLPFLFIPSPPSSNTPVVLS